jgi:hypothetical protein
MKVNRKLIVLSVLSIALVLGVIGVSAQAPDGSGWWVGFTTQNIDTKNNTMVTLAYPMAGAPDLPSNPTSNVIIPVGYAVTFNPGLSATCGAVATNGCRIGFNPDLPAGFQGSVVMSSSGPAVAIAQLNNNTSGNVGVTGGTARAGYQGTGADLAANKLFFPTVKNNFSGQSVGLFVQAAGTDANVSVKYTMRDGSTHTDSKLIPANKTYVFMPGAATPPIQSCNGGNGDKCIGGAVVTSNQPIAGTIVEYQVGVAVAQYVLSTRALVPADAGPTVVAPTMKYDFNGATTGASVLNTDAAATATVDLTFVVTGVQKPCSVSVGAVRTDTITVAPGASQVVNGQQNNIGGLPACTFFAMTASTANNGGEDIAVTVNESATKNGNKVKAVYTGFNTAGATATTFFPLEKENFNGQTTGLAFVNAHDSLSTKIDATYSGSCGTSVLRTISVDPGEAVSLRQVYIQSNKFTVQSGGLPQSGCKYSVSATAVTAGATIVGLGQEAPLSEGKPLDIFNLEGFNQ